MSLEKCLQLQLAKECRVYGLNLTMPSNVSSCGDLNPFPAACFPTTVIGVATLQAAYTRKIEKLNNQSISAISINLVGLVLLALNLLGRLTYTRMKASGAELSPAQVLLLSSDIASLALGCLWWLPVTEILELDRLDLFCHRWVLGAALRLGITAVAAAVLSGQGFLLAATLERLDSMRNPVAFMTRDMKAQRRKIVCSVIGVSVTIAGLSQLEVAHYLHEHRLQPIQGVLNPQISLCLHPSADLLRDCAASDPPQLSFHNQHDLAFHINRLCDWHRLFPFGDELYAAAFAVSQILLTVLGFQLLRIFGAHRKAKASRFGNTKMEITGVTAARVQNLVKQNRPERMLTLVVLGSCFLSLLQFASLLNYAICDLNSDGPTCGALIRWSFLATMAQLSSNLLFMLALSSNFRTHFLRLITRK